MGELVNPGWEVPSIVTGAVIAGRPPLATVIVKTPVPTLNWIVSAPLPAAHSPPEAPDAVSPFAAVIASRSVQTPSSALVSAALVTVMVLAQASGAGNATSTSNANNEAINSRGIVPTPTLRRRYRGGRQASHPIGGRRHGPGATISSPFRYKHPVSRRV